MQIGLREFYPEWYTTESNSWVADIDPSRWRLDTCVANLRRKVFWEICHADKWRVRIPLRNGLAFTNGSQLRVLLSADRRSSTGT